MSLKLNTASGGSITLQEADTASNLTLTVPAQSATLATLTTPSFATTIGVGGATPAASGAGITFPSTQSASSDANTLDDYEEGTWTPANNGMTVNSGSWAATGTYTKVGNIVHFTITQTSGTVTSAAGTGAISGFPFTPSVRGAITFTNGAGNLVGVGLVDLNAILYNSATITSQTALRFSGWYQV